MGGIDFSWGGNKHLLGVEYTGGTFPGGMSEFLASGGTPPTPPVGKTLEYENASCKSVGFAAIPPISVHPYYM